MKATRPANARVKTVKAPLRTIARELTAFRLAKQGAGLLRNDPRGQHPEFPPDEMTRGRTEPARLLARSELQRNPSRSQSAFLREKIRSHPPARYCIREPKCVQVEHLAASLSSETGDDHRDNPRQKQVFPLYIGAIFLFILRFLQVDFENEIQFIIVNNFS